MLKGFHVRHDRRFMVALALAGLFATHVAAATRSDPAAALDLSLASAERSLREGDPRIAESRYRDALSEGWLLIGTLERLDQRLAEAREAFRRASSFKAENHAALQSLAAVHLQMGEAAQAVEILRRLARKAPQDARILHMLVQALTADGQIESAVQKLDELSAMTTDDPQLAFLVANEYLWLKKIDAAERTFARILNQRPSAEARVLIAHAYRDAGEYARARTELQAALDQNPQVRRAHYYMGTVILADGGPDRLEKAVVEFREELKIAPEDPLTNDQLGLALLEAGRYAEALPAFQTSARMEPRSLYVYHLGRCQLALDQPAEAVDSSRRALELAEEQGAGASELEKIHYQLGLALRKLGQRQEAAIHLAEAKSIAARWTKTSRTEQATAMPTTVTPKKTASPVAPLIEVSPLSELAPSQRLDLKRRITAALARAYFNMGVLQAQRREFESAAESFENTAEFAPDFPGIQSSLGVTYFNARRFDEAVEPLARALALSPQDSSLRRMLAIAYLNTKIYDKTADLLRSDPERKTNSELQSAYGLALLRSDRAAEAERIFKKLRARNDDSAELSLLLGQAQAKQEKHAAAIQALKRALRLKPGMPEAHATLGIVYRQQGRMSEAEKELRIELRSYPTNVEALHQLALVLSATQQTEEAVDLLRGILKSQPEHVGARVLLGRVLLDHGIGAEAVEHLEAAARLSPEDADIHDLLARAFQDLGRDDQARRHLETASRIRAEN